jgi:PmbA protein
VAFEALTLLNSVTPETGSYSVILENSVFAEIVSVILPVFYGDTMLKGLSPLKDKVGEKIFSDKFTLTEDPVSPKGRIYRTFDDEGVKTVSSKIIENGVFNKILLNAQTAAKFDVNSTGSAYKKSVQDAPSVGVTNVFVGAGDKSFEDLIKEMGNGLIVTTIQGLHAGIDTLTGDISLLSNGYVVKDGRIVSGAQQMTVAGNFYDMLKDVSSFGNDSGATSFSSMVNLSFVTAPSVLFKNLSVAGK